MATPATVWVRPDQLEHLDERVDAVGPVPAPEVEPPLAGLQLPDHIGERRLGVVRADDRPEDGLDCLQLPTKNTKNWEALDLIVALGGSVWRVTEKGLERRVDATAMEAFAVSGYGMLAGIYAS